MAQRVAQVAYRHSKQIFHLQCFRRPYHGSSPFLTAQAQLTLKKKHSDMSELGLRSHLPPDSNSNPDPHNPLQISDQDWEIRTGSP